MASSTSVFARRREPGRDDGAVFARLREGEGRRERTRAGERVPEVLERRIVGVDLSIIETDELDGSSAQTESVGVCIVAIVVPDRRRSVRVLFWLCTLDRLECAIDAEEEVTGLRLIR
jgi:hypothetical protein